MFNLPLIIERGNNWERFEFFSRPAPESGSRARLDKQLAGVFA